MLKNYILAICLTVAFVPFGLSAQKAKFNAVTTTVANEPSGDDEETVELLKENRELNKQLKDANKELDKLKKDYEKLVKKYDDDVSGKLKKAQDQAIALKNELDSLKKVNSTFEKGQQALIDAKADEMQLVIDSLSRELVAVRQSRDDLAAENTRQSQAIDQRDKELQELEIFKRDYIISLVSVYNTNWANKSFGQIDGGDLDKTIADCLRYAREDGRISETHAKLEALKEQYVAYNAGVQALHSEYNRENVAKLGAQIGKLQNVATGVRKQELSDLFNTLRKYRSGVASFQTLIGNVDKAGADFDTHAQAWPMIEVTLEEDDNANHVKAIKEIPWLESQYEIYMKELKKDCKATNGVHDLILGLSIL